MSKPLQIQYALPEIDTVAKKLLPQLQAKATLIYGAMGSGKTTLIKAMVKALGITETVSSPTFNIVNTYTNDKTTVHHFDLYRIKSENELLEIGFEEYFDEKACIFIEWPERLNFLLPERYNKLQLLNVDKIVRLIKFFYIY